MYEGFLVRAAPFAAAFGGIRGGFKVPPLLGPRLPPFFGAPRPQHSHELVPAHEPPTHGGSAPRLEALVRRERLSRRAAPIRSRLR